MPTLSKLENIAANHMAELEKAYTKEIQQQLASSLTQMYGEMTKIYNKWAKDGILTKAEMTKYNKYITMEKAIVSALDPAIKANIKTIKKLLPETYNESFFQYAWAIDEATGVALAWGNVSNAQIAALLDINNPKNLELKSALTNYGPKAKMAIRSALLKGLTQGKSYKAMADDLDMSIRKIFSSAMTIANTEASRAANLAQNNVYLKAKENGVNGNRVWSTTKDERTRQDHRAMDGVPPESDGLYHLPNGETAMYPVDPNLSAENSINCRCKERFEVDGYSPELMRTREEGVIPYMPYNEYAKKYHPEWLK
jgi:hypothetical protein